MNLPDGFHVMIDVTLNHIDTLTPCGKFLIQAIKSGEELINSVYLLAQTGKRFQLLHNSGLEGFHGVEHQSSLRAGFERRHDASWRSTAAVEISEY